MPGRDPPPGHVESIVVDPVTPSTVYAGTTTGRFKSVDGGATWSAPTPGLTTWITSLLVDPMTPAVLYAGIYDAGVFKS
jgi:hypothetical protein